MSGAPIALSYSPLAIGYLAIMKVLSIAITLLASVYLVGCDAGGDLVGEWQAVQDEETTLTITFAADSTFTMDTGTFVGEGRYTLDEMQLALEPTGALATVVPGGFTGELVDWTKLNVCSPSGVCTEFQKVR